MVYRNVLSPLSALITGPSIDSGPMQYSSMAVDSPSARLRPLFVFERRSTARLNLPSMSAAVPTTLPMASESMNSTGNLLLGMLLMAALSPIMRLASPRALYNAVLYLSFIPRLRIVPAMVPAIIAHVLTIVPIIIRFFQCAKLIIIRHTSLIKHIFYTGVLHN